MENLDNAAAGLLVNEQMMHFLFLGAPCLWGNLIQFLLLIGAELCDASRPFKQAAKQRNNKQFGF